MSARVLFPLSPESRSILGELDDLRTAARALLEFASQGACDEWTKLESRCPSELELRRGIIALSIPELKEMRSKVRRFRDILATSRRVAQASEASVDDGPGGDEHVRNSGIARP
jgi:hypothetical protein